MDFRPKTRQHKLLDALYPYFGDMAEKYHRDQPIRVCRHLRNMRDKALSDPWITPFLSDWDKLHPEENSLNVFELHWALKNFDTHISAQMAEIQRNLTAKKSPKARLRVINGGLSENPDIPYVDPHTVHEYPDF